MSVGMGSVGVVVGSLARLVRPLMGTCMGYLVVGVVCSNNLARSSVFLKQVVISSCLEAERSCSDVGPRGRMSILLGKRPS